MTDPKSRRQYCRHHYCIQGVQEHASFHRGPARRRHVVIIATPTSQVTYMLDELSIAPTHSDPAIAKQSGQQRARLQPSSKPDSMCHVSANARCVLSNTSSVGRWLVLNIKARNSDTVDQHRCCCPCARTRTPKAVSRSNYTIQLNPVQLYISLSHPSTCRFQTCSSAVMTSSVCQEPTVKHYKQRFPKCPQVLQSDY